MANIVKNLNGETVLEDGKTIKEWMDEAELDPTVADNEEPRAASPTSSSAARAAIASVSEPARISTPSSMRMARRSPSSR